MLVLAMRVQMRVRVLHVAVAVPVSMHEVCPQQETGIRQDLARRTIRSDTPLIKHYDAVGDVFDDFDLVRSRYHRLRRVLPLISPACRAGISEPRRSALQPNRV